MFSPLCGTPWGSAGWGSKELGWGGRWGAGSRCWLLPELGSIELPLLKKQPSENRPCEATRNLHSNKRVHHDHDREISSCGEGEGRMWVFWALRRKPEHHLAARLWGPQALRWLRLCQADLWERKRRTRTFGLSTPPQGSSTGAAEEPWKTFSNHPLRNSCLAFVCSPNCSVQVNTAQGFLSLPESSLSTNEERHKALEKIFHKICAFLCKLQPLPSTFWNQFNCRKMGRQKKKWSGF